jgi:hypothetical protein
VALTSKLLFQSERPLSLADARAGEGALMKHLSTPCGTAKYINIYLKIYQKNELGPNWMAR